MRRRIFQNWNFDLSEVRDWAEDPAPRMQLTWRIIDHEGGRCMCGRKFPPVAAAVEIEEEEAIRLCRSIISFYATRRARKIARGAQAKVVKRKYERLMSREIDFLRQWEAELRGADPLDT